MQAVVFYLITPLLWLLSRSPFWLLYLISDVLFVIVYHIIGYRKKVIFNNLDIAFPNKSSKEKKLIAQESIRHLCDNFMEMIKTLGITNDELDKRYTCDNVDDVNAFAKAGKSIIVMVGHQASYEWMIGLDKQLIHEAFAIYKPIKNKHFDHLVRRVRSKFGTTLVPMKTTYSRIQAQQKKGVGLYALIADQAPKPYKAKHFTNFFNRPTAVMRGGERIAATYEMPVFFLNVKKIKRGYYTCHAELITTDASKEKDWAVTDSFFTKLEKQIREQPQYYLWSHKRWKTSLDDVKNGVELSPLIQR